MSESARCTRILSGRRQCGGRIEATQLRGGDVSFSCSRCSRYDAGLCIECGTPIRRNGRTGAKPCYCKECARTARLAAMKRHDQSTERMWRRKHYEKRRYQRDKEERCAYARQQRMDQKLAIIRSIGRGAS